MMPLGFKHSLESRKKMSAARKKNNPGGFKHGNKIRVGKKFTAETIIKLRQASIRAGCRPPSALGKKGKLSGAWRGGVSPEHHRIRNSYESKLWRISVLKRDNYTCVFCGYISKLTKPLDVQVDHIKRFAEHPELRFIISNGRTLCIPCHKKTDTYGCKTKPFKSV